MQSPIASAGAHRRNVNWATHDFNDIRSWPIGDTPSAMPECLLLGHRFDTAEYPTKIPDGTKLDLGRTRFREHVISTYSRHFFYCIIIAVFPGLALTRDLDVKYANSPFKQWFDSLGNSMLGFWEISTIPLMTTSAS